MYPCTCMSPFIMSYCRRVVIPLSFTTVYVSHCSYNLLVGPRGDVRMVSLMVNGYADIYKDNTQNHLRTHTMSNRRSIITTGLKLFRISMQSTEPALSTVAVKPKIMVFKTPSNNGKCHYWYCILSWSTGVIPGYPQCVQQIHVKTLWGFMSTQAGLSLLWIYLSFCRLCCGLAHLLLWCTTL